MTRMIECFRTNQHRPVPRGRTHVKTGRRFLITLVFLAGWMVLLSGAAIWPSALSPSHAASKAEEFPEALYTPPKKFTPRARVGGELRGTAGNTPEVQALVPDHVGLTVNRSPDLNWFLSKPTSNPIVFTLVDNRAIKPLHEITIPTPSQAGIHKISMKDLGIGLDPNVQYRWYISVITDPDSPSQHIVAGGVIERCEFSECVAEIGARLTCSKEVVIENAKAGLWYDAMGCLCNLIDAKPQDSVLRRLRAALLKQVGLNGVAEWDLRSITSSIR